MTGQAEGFNLMIYSCPNKHTEIVWNSRDGITPFGISCRCCSSGMTHVAWDADVKVPDFKPPKGMRIFIDLTIEKAREQRRKQVEQDWIWEGLETSLKDLFASKEEAVEKLAQDDVASFAPHTPDLVTVE